MSMFATLEKNDTSIKEVKDSIGFAKVDKTGFYEMTIEKAYAGMSSGGAFSVTIQFKSDEGAKLTVTEYITSGTKKGCKNYYVDRNGNKQYLPGYNKIKSLDALLGFERDYPATDKGTIMLWDYDLKKEIPKEMELIKEWVGKKIGCLITIGMEDKNVKNSAGDYVPSPEVKNTTEIGHFIDLATDKTRNEVVAAVDAKFKDKWLAAYPETYVKDDRNLSKGASAGTTPDVAVEDELKDSPF